MTKSVAMKKNICMIAYTDYANDARVRREAETLADDPQYVVSVLSLKQNHHPSSYQLNGVHVKELNLSKYQGKSFARYLLSYFDFLLLAFVEITRRLFHKLLDVVHVHNMPNFILFSAVLPLLFGKKIVLDVHDTMIETYMAKFMDRCKPGIMRKLLGFEESVCCSMAHRIICVNDVQRDVMVARGIPKNKTIISMNLPDPRMFSTQSRKSLQRHDNEVSKLVYHGTISKRLSIDLAIKAIARLNQKGCSPRLEFHIVGEGDDMEEFERLSHQLGVDELVFFRGKKPLDEIVPLLEEMDLGIITNERNAATELMLPVKMMECIAMGIPVIVPRLRAIEHYFSDEMVTYFEPGSLESLSEAIQFLVATPERKREKVARAQCFLDRCGWDKQKSTLLDMYKKL